MPIEISCPKCGKAGRVRDSAAGKTCRCKRCGTEFLVAAGQASGPAALEQTKRSTAGAHNQQRPPDRPRRTVAARPVKDASRDFQQALAAALSVEEPYEPDEGVSLAWKSLATEPAFIHAERECREAAHVTQGQLQLRCCTG